MAEWDFSQVDRLVGDLGKVPGAVVPLARKVIEVGAEKVKRGMAADIEAGVGPHLQHLPRAVDYDLHGLSAEVGINKAKPQGPLGNVAAFGTSNNGPLFDHAASLNREAPIVMQLLGEAGAKAVDL